MVFNRALTTREKSNFSATLTVSDTANGTQYDLDVSGENVQTTSGKITIVGSYVFNQSNNGMTITLNEAKYLQDFEMD